MVLTRQVIQPFQPGRDKLAGTGPGHSRWGYSCVPYWPGSAWPGIGR